MFDSDHRDTRLKGLEVTLSDGQRVIIEDCASMVSGETWILYNGHFGEDIRTVLWTTILERDHLRRVVHNLRTGYPDNQEEVTE